MKVDRVQISTKRSSEDYFWAVIFDTLHKSRLSEAAQIRQHGQISCLLHSIGVAYYCYLIASRFPVLLRRKGELIRGALLHDYFLYDWHCYSSSHRGHGFTHAKVALCNADQDFCLSEVEQNIILRHMFPLNVLPPKYIESYLVCFIDKICTIYEFFYKNAYSDLSDYLTQRTDLKGYYMVQQ